MEVFNPVDFSLFQPSPHSHKGENGKLLIIAGSILFHAASLWPLKIASRIVDMVLYSSVPNNNDIVIKNKEEFRDGIVVPRNKLDSYIKEADCILIGPGLPRKDGMEEGDEDTKHLTERLLQMYPEKQWVVDGGSLQMIKPDILPQNAIVTPHTGEFERLFGTAPTEESVVHLAKLYNIIIVSKGETDLVASREKAYKIIGGNAGLTKGGTGDVLAGLIAALACKNEPLTAALFGSYINKKAGDALFKKMGYYYNASDLVDEIPLVLKELT